MRLAILLFLCTLPCFAQGSGCGSAIQIIEDSDRLLIKNISDQPLTAYRITKINLRDRKQVRTYEGNFTGGDQLRPGQTMEVGEAERPLQLLVDYVRLANGWQCGNAGDAAPAR